MMNPNNEILFCTSCGNKIYTPARFCPHCGKSVPTEAPRKIELQAFPQIGTPVTTYRKAKDIVHKSNTNPNIQIDWLNDSVDLIFTESHFVIVSAAKQTALKEFSDKIIPRMGAFGIVLGPLAAVNLAIVGSISEGVFGQKNSLDQDALAQFFGAGLAICAKKDALKFQLSSRRRAIIYTDFNVAVTGLWRVADQEIDLTINFSEMAVRDVSIKKIFQKGRCSMIEVA